MKKYFFIYKSELMSTLQYIGNILFSTIAYFILIYILFQLWDYVYDDPNELIKGYSKAQMIWYVIITEILWKACDGRRFCRKICNEVKTGNIAYNMNKPYSYVGYTVFSHLGESTVKGVIFSIAGVIIGLAFLGNMPAQSIVSILTVIVSSILAVTIDAFFITIIGMLAFFIEDSNPIYWLYSKFILVLGTIFPIEFFPLVLQKILVFSPLYATCYGPAKLFVSFSLSNAMSILCAQIIYLFISYGLCEMLYRKGVKRINVNGG